MTNRVDTELRLSLNNGAYTKARAGLESMAQSLSRLRREVLGFAGGFASLRGIQQLAQLADQANTLRAKLANVTEGQEEFNTAQRETLAIAQRTATPLAAVVETFDRLLLPMRELKRSQADTLALTEALAAGFAVEGSSAAEAAGKIERFAMQLAQGELSAAALNSIALESPAIMQALAAGLNVPIGRLRDLAKQGRLTAEEVVGALLSQRDNLVRQYEALPKTIGGALMRIKNQFMVTLGDIDRQFAISGGAAAGLNGIANNMRAVFEGVATMAKVLAAIMVAQLLPAVLAATAAKIKLAIVSRAVAAEMGITAGSMRAYFTSVTGALTALLSLAAAFYAGFKIGEYLRDNFKIARDAGYALVGGLLEVWERLKAGFQAIGPVLVLAWAGTMDRLREIAATFYDSVAKIFDRLPGTFAAAMAESMRGAAAELRAGIGEGVGAQAALELDAITDEAQQRIEEIRESMAALVGAPMDSEVAASSGGANGGGVGGGKGAAESFETFKAGLKRIEQELEASYARRQITEQQYIEAKTDLQIIGIDREIREEEQKRAKARGDERREIEQHIGELKALRVTVEQQALAEIAEKRAKFLEDQAAKVTERLQRREERIARDRSLGSLGAVDAKAQTGDARRQAKAELDELIAAAEQLQGALGIETAERLKAMRDGLVDMKSPLRELGDEIKSNIQDPLADAFASVIDGTRSAKEAIKDLGNAVIDTIVRIIAQRLAADLVDGLPFAKGGAVLKRAAGGFVSGPGGPTDDRVPAMLSNGEYVLQASAVRRYGVAFLNALNGRSLPQRSGPAYATGGMVSGSRSFARETMPAPVVNVINQVDGATASVSSRKGADGRDVVDVVLQAVARDIRDGGAVWQSVAAAGGLRRQGRST